MAGKCVQNSVCDECVRKPVANTVERFVMGSFSYWISRKWNSKFRIFFQISSDLATDASVRGAQRQRQQSNANKEINIFITSSLDDLRSRTPLLIIAQQKSVARFCVAVVVIVVAAHGTRRARSLAVITVDFIFSPQSVLIFHVCGMRAFILISMHGRAACVCVPYLQLRFCGLHFAKMTSCCFMVDGNQ